MDDFEDKNEGWIHAIFAVLRNEVVSVPPWDSMMEQLDQAVVDQRFKHPNMDQMSNVILSGVSKLGRIRFFEKKQQGDDDE